jgi:hypothetical protein
MRLTPLFQGAAQSVVDYRCNARPGQRSVVEHHRLHSISYVRRGSFGCRSRGRGYELVAGALLVGSPEQEYVCSHEHHDGGDECLSFQFAPALIDAVGGGEPAWQVAA